MELRGEPWKPTPVYTEPECTLFHRRWQYTLPKDASVRALIERVEEEHAGLVVRDVATGSRFLHMASQTTTEVSTRERTLSQGTAPAFLHGWVPRSLFCSPDSLFFPKGIVDAPQRFL